MSGSPQGQQPRGKFTAPALAAGACTIDWSQGDYAVVNATANATVTHTNMVLGGEYTMEFIATGANTTLTNSPVATKGTGTALTPSAGAGDTTIYKLKCTSAAGAITLLSKS